MLRGKGTTRGSLLSHPRDVRLPPRSVPSLSYTYFILSVPTASNHFFKGIFLLPFSLFFPPYSILAF